jgi:hypothetical protein
VASRNSKKKNKLKLLNYVSQYDVLKEPIDKFKSRLEGMPVFLLLNEHRHISEQYGAEAYKSKQEWNETLSKIHQRSALVQQKILETMHTLYDQMLAADYYTDLTYREQEEKKNVEVSKKSNK